MTQAKRYVEIAKVKRFISAWLKEAVDHDDIELPALESETKSFSDILKDEGITREKIVKALYRIDWERELESIDKDYLELYRRKADSIMKLLKGEEE